MRPREPVVPAGAAGAGARPPPVELSADPAFAHRIRRLTLVSAVALGAIWRLGADAASDYPLIGAGLAGAWVLMPLVLWLSLRRPLARYALAAPASLLTLSLLAISVWAPPAEPLARAGWSMLTAGVLMGGVQGAWFWFRILPVPDSLNEPFAPARQALIAIHVALLVVGTVLVAAPALA